MRRSGSRDRRPARHEGGAILDGGIRLKDRQKLRGTMSGGVPTARLTNTTGTGDAITLANGTEVAALHIENPSGAAIFGDNVSAAVVQDLLITHTMAVAPSALDPALCRIVREGNAVDNAASTLRGCTGRQVSIPAKHAIMFLADDGAGPAPKYRVQRVTIRDNPSHDQPRVLWPLGISVVAAGRVAATLDVDDSSIEYTVRGVLVRGLDRATVTANLTNLRLDSLRSDGVGIATGFVCSGLDKSFKTLTLDCTTLPPAPVSDARVVVNANGLKFSDSQRRGQPNDAGVFEPVPMDQGRSTIELHVERSDITGAAAAGFFTFYVNGRPARDVMDFGCVNPNPGATSPDRDACRRLGYTSTGQNRIFGNTRNSVAYSPITEVALQGPGRMLAQGNYWGDLKPVDGKGDAMGECSVFDWNGDPKDTSPPVKPVPDSRCELYNVPGQGNPSGIDGRFHLAADPRPPRK